MSHPWHTPARLTKAGKHHPAKAQHKRRMGALTNLTCGCADSPNKSDSSIWQQSEVSVLAINRLLTNKIRAAAAANALVAVECTIAAAHHTTTPNADLACSDLICATTFCERPTLFLHSIGMSDTTTLAHSAQHLLAVPHNLALLPLVPANLHRSSAFNPCGNGLMLAVIKHCQPPAQCVQ